MKVHSGLCPKRLRRWQLKTWPTSRAGGDAIRAGHGQVWLSNYKSGVEWKLDPKAIAAIQP
jgi:streptogramin lyase